MTNRDIIERMKDSGDWSSALEFEEKLRDHGHSEYDRPDRFNPADGARYSHAGDCAETAYRELRSRELRKEERLDEELAEQEAAERANYERNQRDLEEAGRLDAI